MRSTKASRRAAEILLRLEPLYADLTTGLIYTNAWELLVATILSAQCTDERVNIVTPGLFKRFPSPDELADAESAEVEVLIHSCGFFRNKTKSIQAAAEAVRDRFDGRVPATMAELVTLPGVARKTANVVLAHAFQCSEGIAVDTHVMRLSGRLGMSKERAPEKIERDLMRIVAREQWGRVSDVLIWHGRRVCHARRPACTRCPLADICPSAAGFLAFGGPDLV